jgi:sterol desaturase/sphingolipid hydroxylase (fatty acid hydroxylase superfamily)
LNDASTSSRFFAHPVDVTLAATARLSSMRINAHAGLIADCSVTIALIGAGLWRRDIGVVPALAIFAAGLLLFSFIEYCFHRWLFHGRAGMFEQGHTRHHEDPLGYDALPFFLPPLGLIGLTALMALIMPASAALLLMGALAVGYAAYGIGHTAIHSLRFTRALSRRWAAAHHIHHHHPGSNFGVTTPLWDILLGTRYVASRTPPPQHG